MLPSDNYEDLQEEDYHREAPRRDFRSVVRTGVMLYLPIAMLFISFAALESFKGSDAHMQPTTPTPTTTPSMILTLFHDQGVNERVPQVLLVVAYFMATYLQKLTMVALSPNSQLQVVIEFYVAAFTAIPRQLLLLQLDGWADFLTLQGVYILLRLLLLSSLLNLSPNPNPR